MDNRERGLKTLDRLYRDVMGRGPTAGETRAEWRAAANRILRDWTMQARARGMIAEAQHAARMAEIEAAHISPG
jgi:hypothetical protein